MDRHIRHRSVPHSVKVIHTVMIFSFFFLFAASLMAEGNAQETPIINKGDPILLEYFYQPGCDICIEKEGYIDDLQTAHPELNITKTAVVYGENHTEYFAYTESLGFGRPSAPVAIFHKGSCAYLIPKEDFTPENLELWYQRFIELEGECPDWNEEKDEDDNTQAISPWIAFASGFVTGLSPCVVLITGVISSTLLTYDSEKGGNKNDGDENEDNRAKIEDNTPVKTSNESEKQSQIPRGDLLKLFAGFLLGVMLMYILLGVALVTTFDWVASTFFGTTVRIVFAVLMIALGAWYMIDAFNTESKLFKTPDSFKKFFKNLATKGTFWYAFTLGFVFSFLKIPCVAAILVALLFGVSADPSQFLGSLLLFYLGLLIPLLLLMGILAYGTQRNTIDKIRIKYRPYLRLLAGLLIIGLTIYAVWP